MSYYHSKARSGSKKDEPPIPKQCLIQEECNVSRHMEMGKSSFDTDCDEQKQPSRRNLLPLIVQSTMGSPIFLVFFPHAARDLLDGRWRRCATLVVIDLSKRSRVVVIAGNFFGCLFGRLLVLGAGGRLLVLGAGRATLLGYGFILFRITVILFGGRLSTFTVLLLAGCSSPSAGALPWNGTVLFGCLILFFFLVFHHLGRRLVFDSLFGTLLCRLARHGLLDGLSQSRTKAKVLEASKKECQQARREWRF